MVFLERRSVDKTSQGSACEVVGLDSRGPQMGFSKKLLYVIYIIVALVIILAMVVGFVPILR